MDGGTGEQGRILTVANIVLAVFIAAALIGFAIFGFVKDPPKEKSGTQHADTAARLRDRVIDPAKLIEAEIFPQRSFAVQSHRYTLLAQENLHSCPSAARGDRLIQALGNYECNQVIRGTMRDDSGQYAATLGIANLADAPGAAEIDQLLNDPGGNGAFTLQSLPNADNRLKSRKKVIDHRSQGHYLLFVTVVKLDVPDYDATDPVVTAMLRDGLDRLASVINARAPGG
ncbi:MAG TPA: hypothetical protein VHU91_03845 [Mycobacteriales bacterium]|nr:hypothetical protein [Mycobacteriales bacterium]